MNQATSLTGPREIGAIIRQTADLRRLCLSLQAARNQEKEAAFVEEFEGALRHADGTMPVVPEVVRAGFRSLWREGQYDRIVSLAHRLPEDLLQGDETVLMYYLCALRRRAWTPSVAGSQE